MSTPPTAPHDSDGALRLEGWKAIANHLGRSVRTAHRWEQELGLPVHRMGTGRGEVVYAVPAELDAWRQTLEVTPGGLAVLRTASDDTTAANGTKDAERSSVSTTAAGVELAPHQRPASTSNWWTPGWVLAIGGGLVLAALAVLGWVRLSARPPEPASFSVVDGVLRVLDSNEQLLWSHRFDEPLLGKAYAKHAQAGTEAGILTDIDGDGHVELLFMSDPDWPSSRGLFCFDYDGTERFRRQPDRIVHYGGSPYAGPWRAQRVFVTPGSGATKSIWLVSSHFQEFPSVVEKFAPKGQRLGEYWSDGHITSLSLAQVGNRRVVLVGGVNNEHKGGSLAVLDEQAPWGAAPAVAPHYTCGDCPAGRPAQFIVFPPTEVPTAIGGFAAVKQINVENNGHIRLEVFQDAGQAFEASGGTGPNVYYLLDSNLKVIDAEFGQTYEAAHRFLEKSGLIGHPFVRDKRTLFPVLRWDGSGFAEIPAPASDK